jgi:CHAT domain-containing protein
VAASSRLTLVELYLERASDAWNGLQVLATAAPGSYDITPTIASGVGPLRRQVDSGYRGADYDYITATSTTDDTIQFALDTKRARTEVRAQSTQGKLLRELVRRASTDGNDDPRLGHTLFQLLVPLEVEPFLAGTGRMVLELDDRTASIPWELLDTRGEDRSQLDDRPWAIRTRLLRKLRQENYRQQVQDAQADDAVLVIGEPQADEKLYAPLPGARQEAQAVAELLAGSGGLGAERVKALPAGADATSVINALFERRYRIVHVAGHGEPVKRNAKGEIVQAGGVVLSDGTFLGPNEIRSMRTVPELVFVNCCHGAARDAAQALRGSGTTDRAFNKAEFAWGVADSLIEIGVRCVIAAGWAVDDGPAKVFAETFYREILNRRPFIDAVATAREAAFNEDRSSKTWAAYQAYGDPNWIYRRGPDERVSVSRPPREEFDSVASPLGLALALEEVAVKTKWMRAPAAEQLEKVRHLEARFASLWGGMGAVAEAFGVAYNEAGDRDAAIAWYERALRANDGSASLKAHEQLGNLRARRGWAWASAKAASAARVREAREEITAALKALQTLAALQPTIERHCLCGSAWKRLALLQRQQGQAEDARASLEMAARSYGEGEALARASEDPDLHYPASNRMALELALHAGDPAWGGFTAEATAAARRALKAKVQAEPDFWGYAGLVELDVFEALAERRLAEVVDDALAHYAELHARVASTGLWGSVADTATLVLGASAARSRGAEAAAAGRLQAALDGYAQG